MKHFLVMLLALCGMYINAQTVTVVDRLTREPLVGAGVVAYPKTPLFTNSKGKADITTLKDKDSIFITFSNYKLQMVSYTQLQKMKFIVELEELNISLSEVVISANRIKEDKLETPNRIQKINMKEVAFQNPQTTADLLGTGGYAFIQKSQLGGGSPMLRGMATNRVLLVVDGVRMNNAIFRAGNLQTVISLDANALEGTEILFGPGSVMYGSDAIGGVMSFNTLEPKFCDTTTKITVQGNALMRTSTANSENTRHLNFNIGLKKWAFVTSYTRGEYGDLRAGSVGGDAHFYRPNYVQTIANKDYMVPNNDSTLQVGSKYSQNNFMQKVRFKPNKNWEIDYGFHFSETSPYNRYDRLYVMQTQGPYKNKLRWAEWYYGPQVWKMHRLGVIHSKKNSAYDHLRVTMAMQDFEESRYDREFMVRELRMQKETVKALSLNVDLDKQISEKLTVCYGLELVQNKVGSTASLTHVITKEVDSTVTRYPNGSIWQSYGAYASLKYKLHKNLIVSSGIRWSAYRIEAAFDTLIFPFPFTRATMRNQTLNGSLGLVYTPHRTWQMYLNVATGFRAPNIDDMGKVFESTPGYLLVPNPNLKPEHAYNAEIGTVKTFGNFLKADVAGYYTLLKNAMERKDFTFNGQSTIRYQGNKSNIQAVQNVAQAYVYGLQAGLEFNWKGFGIRGAYSWQQGKEQSPDSLIYYPLRHAAPAFGSAHFTYQHKKMKFDFYTIYNSRMDYEELALTERVNTSYARDFTKDPKGQAYTDSWYTLNFKAAFFLNQYVVVMAGVENISDILYRPYGSGISASGRNIIAALKARF